MTLCPPTAPRRLVLAAVTNWLAFAATLLTAFFLFPYLTQQLGDRVYAVWLWVESILAYFTLLDLGVAACIVRYVARFHATGEQTELNRMVSAALVCFMAAAAIILLGGLILAPLLTPLLERRTEGAPGIFAFILVMATNLALLLPLSVFPSILDGLQRYAVKSLIRIVFLGLRVTGMVWVCEHHPGLLPLALVYTLSHLAEHLAFAVLAFVFLPGLRFRIGLIDRETLRRVHGYSVDAFLAMVAGRITVQSGMVVIGLFLALPQVTFFGIAARLVEYAKALLRSASTTLTPAISSLEARGDRAAIREILIRATRWLLYLMLPVQVGLCLFGAPFIQLWMKDPSYAVACVPTLRVLSIPLSLVIAQSVASRILYGLGQLRWFARLALLEALVNLVFSLILVKLLGSIGVAWAIVVPNALFCVMVIRMTLRLTDVSLRDYLEQCWGRPVMMLVLPIPIWLSLLTQVEPTRWSLLAGVVAAGLVPFAAAVLVVETRLLQRMRVLRIRLPRFAESVSRF